MAPVGHSSPCTVSPVGRPGFRIPIAGSARLPCVSSRSPPELLFRTVLRGNTHRLNIFFNTDKNRLAYYVYGVCVVIPFILEVRFVDVIPAGVTQEEGHTGFPHLPSAVLALVFLARRIQPFLSLVDHEVEFCVLTIL